MLFVDVNLFSILASTASSSSGNRCDRTKERLVQSQTDRERERTLWTMDCVLWLRGVSSPESDHFYLLDCGVKSCAQLSRSVWPQEQLSHLCRNSNDIILVVADIVCLYTPLNLEERKKERKKTTVLFYRWMFSKSCFVFTSRTLMNVTQLLQFGSFTTTAS